MSVNVGGKERRRGPEAVAEEEKKEEKSKVNPSDYSCEVILEKTTKDKTFPSDAYLVWYNVDGSELLDLTRSAKKSNIFDMYYDKYSSDLKRIEYGHGTVNPSQWGYKSPEKKKRRRKE